MSHSRKRIDRRRRYRHDGVAEPHAQAPVSARASENVVVNVHVHNEIAPADPSAAKRRARTTPPIRLPSFRGTLYSWKDHYQPIVNRLAPIVAQREKSRGGSRVRRLCLAAALIAAVAAVGCGLL